MKEQLINFETAKLAKEKGVKLDINGLYWEDGSYDSGENALVYEEFQDVMSAPTQSLLQKWLREVHKINVESNYLPNVEKYRCLFIPMTLKKPSEYSTPGTAFTSRFNYLGKEHYNTYEEALETGLQEGLKLIK